MQHQVISRTLENDMVSTRVEERCARTWEFSFSDKRGENTAHSVETKREEYSKNSDNWALC